MTEPDMEIIDLMAKAFVDFKLSAFRAENHFPARPSLVRVEHIHEARRQIELAVQALDTFEAQMSKIAERKKASGE